MAVRDYTGEFLNTLKFFQPNVKPIDFSSVLDNYNTAYDKSYNKALNNAFSDALASGDEDRASKIAAMLDPARERERKQALAKRAEDRKWEEEKLQRTFDLQKELAQMKYNQARNLAEFKAGLGDQGTTAMRNIEYLSQKLGIDPKDAAALYYGGQNPSLDLANLGQKGQEAYDKAIGAELAQQEASKRQVQKLSPVAENAIKEARGSLKQGEGLGQVGGKLWTTGQGGRNRENIARAKRQMNIMIRGALKEVGVGSKELDAAAEAEAYRANLAQDLPIEQQEQILDNFVKDYLSGNIHKELAEKYGKTPSLKDFKPKKDWSKATNAEVLEGL